MRTSLVDGLVRADRAQALQASATPHVGTGGHTPGAWKIVSQHEAYTFGENDVPVVFITVPCAETSDGLWHRAIEVRGPDAIALARLIESAPDLAAENTILRRQRDEMVQALKRADEFITNGIDLGFIRMPDPATPDPAHETPEIIRAALRSIGEA